MKKLICWLLGHKFESSVTEHTRIDDRWEVTNVTRICTRCSKITSWYDTGE